MNGVYGDAVIAADQIWLRKRLDLIASAENLTYYLPYFRERFNYFPKYIYYTATDKDVKDFREKYVLDERKVEFDFSPQPSQEAAKEKNVQEIEAGLLKVIETKLSELQQAHERDMEKMMALLMERLPVPVERPPNMSS